MMQTTDRKSSPMVIPLTGLLCMVSFVAGAWFAATPESGYKRQQDAAVGACIALAMAEGHGFVHPDRRRLVLRALTDQIYPLRDRLPSSQKALLTTCDQLDSEP